MKKSKKILKMLKADKKFCEKLYKESVKENHNETLTLIRWNSYTDAHNKHEIARRICKGIDL